MNTKVNALKTKISGLVKAKNDDKEMERAIDDAFKEVEKINREQIKGKNHVFKVVFS